MYARKMQYLPVWVKKLSFFLLHWQTVFRVLSIMSLHLNTTRQVNISRFKDVRYFYWKTRWYHLNEHLDIFFGISWYDYGKQSSPCNALNIIKAYTYIPQFNMCMICVFWGQTQLVLDQCIDIFVPDPSIMNLL